MEHTFKNYFTHMSDLAVCRGKERRIILVNLAFIKVFGGSVEDWTGRHFDGAELGAQIGAFHDSRAYGQVRANGQTYWIEWDEAELSDGGTIAIGRLNFDRRSECRGAASPKRDRRRNKSAISVSPAAALDSNKPAPPPAALSPGTPEPHSAPVTSAKQPGIKINAIDVLLVEDDPLSAKLATALLERENCTVTCADNGREALELAQNRSFDLVFMDMRMPMMDGPSACRAIRALGGAWADIPIIALTANAFDEDRKTCHAAGMTGFVTKPIDAQTLSEARQRWGMTVKQEKLA